MPITFLLDENLPSRIWRAIQRHNEHNADILDVVCVGQSDDLPFSVDDPSILLWAERQGRILITEDKSTMPAHLAAHLDKGYHSPGIFMVRPATRVPDLLEFLVLLAYASQSTEWRDRIEYIP
jgi:predicted nuclease of predicted toxin-antitoxin system